MKKLLIFIPTYNECENVSRMVEAIFSLRLEADVLFLDDSSPDGTGDQLEKMKSRFQQLIVHHRSGKNGIGSAHAQVIDWAYDRQYDILVTLDCDFTHSPYDIPLLIERSLTCDVAIGSRWVKKGCLPGWSIFRYLMTFGGHLLTRAFLGLTEDASNAFRSYNLKTLPRGVFNLVQSNGYAFFCESLLIFKINHLNVQELATVLPGRASGNSKMSLAAVMNTLSVMASLSFRSVFRRNTLLLDRSSDHLEILKRNI